MVETPFLSTIKIQYGEFIIDVAPFFWWDKRNILAQAYFLLTFLTFLNFAPLTPLSWGLAGGGLQE